MHQIWNLYLQPFLRYRAVGVPKFKSESRDPDLVTIDVMLQVLDSPPRSQSTYQIWSLYLQRFRRYRGGQRKLKVGHVTRTIFQFDLFFQFLSLLKAYCSSFYGSVVWNLSHSSIDDFCAIWRKRFRCIPHNTHCALLPLLSHSLLWPSLILGWTSRVLVESSESRSRWEGCCFLLKWAFETSVMWWFYQWFYLYQNLANSSRV